MDALETLQTRGFVQQLTHPEELAARLASGPITYYVGVDPTADSMHVGHLLPVMAMAWLQRAGHKPIAVVGGGTAMVGDPSGRTELRQMLTPERIAANAAGLKRQLGRFLDFGEGRGRLVDNADWLLQLQLIPFLREIGSQFSVNKMLTAEAYRQRLERGLSFIELNYQILQAYDFLELYRRHGCELQMGGDDQWGNILAGVDLVRRKEAGARVFGLTHPLLTTSTGAKMGKTAAGAVWLDPARVSPFDYYQYWLNVPDPDVIRLLKLYTFLPLDQIEELARLSGADIREAKRTLAHEATALVHGPEEAQRAAAGARAMVAGAAADDLPTLAVSGPRELLDLLVEVGFAASRGEAKRLIAGGGVKLGAAKVEDIAHLVDPAELGQDGLVLRAGKKRAARLTR